MHMRDQFRWNTKALDDLIVEQQTFSPQARISVDYARAKLFGITPAQITDVLEGFPMAALSRR